MGESNAEKNSMPTVSIIVPVRNMSDSEPVKSCIDSLSRQDFQKTYEIIVTEQGNRPEARNLGLKIAKGQYIAFIDSDCEAPSDWLTRIVAHLETETKSLGVGGPNVPPPAKNTWFTLGANAALDSFLGGLHSPTFFTPRRKMTVNKLPCCNSAFYAADLRKIGGFNETFEMCEDAEISKRIVQAGGTLAFYPAPSVVHSRNDTPRSFSRRFYEYGSARMRSVITNTALFEYPIFAPLIALAILLIVGLVFPITILFAIILYLSLIIAQGTIAAFQLKRANVLLSLPFALVIEHVSYLAGMIRGLFSGKWKMNHSINPSRLAYHQIVQRPIAERGTVDHC